jgi:hypothetical protein
MTTCRRCGTSYDTLACPLCIERFSREESLRQQPHYLEKTRSGTYDYLLATYQQHKPHVQLFGNPNQAFCGISLSNMPRRTKCSFYAFNPDDICSECVKVIVALTKEAQAIK